MNYTELDKALRRFEAISRELEDTELDLDATYEENGGEITAETELMERKAALLDEQRMILKEYLKEDGIDYLGRVFLAKQDQIESLKAEKKRAEARIKAAEASLDNWKYLINRTLTTINEDGTEAAEKAKGAYYTFAPYVKTETKVDSTILRERYQDRAEQALRDAGIPEYIHSSLTASTTGVGIEPELYKVAQLPTVKFTKPRKAKD